MIRAATVADAGRLAELHAACFDDAWDMAAMRALLAGPGARAFLDVAGFVLVRAVADEAEVLSLAVQPSARGKGNGGALLATAIEALRTDGILRLFLEVSDRNAPAQALYARLGFMEIGRRAEYYADCADARVLSLELA